MLFNDADEELVKAWVIKKLEDVSDADADVLADYVLALVKTDEPDASAKSNCIENLKDFLGDGSEKFVRELFAALASKSYDPSRPPPKPSRATYRPPRRASFEPPPQHPGSKKRSYHDWDRDESQSAIYEGHARPTKQARQGGRGFDCGSWPQRVLQPPTPPPGMPPFDPGNPLASLHVMYQAMGMIPPGFPAPPGAPSFANGSGSGHNRCRDYDTKGFCTRGASCPYEHGEDPHVVTGNEYDPNNATLLHVQPTRTGIVSTSAPISHRGGQRGRGRYRGGKRAEISQYGPNSDRSNTTIVVENIPEEKHDEQSVRDFFGQFGSVEEITLQPHRHIAIVKFGDFESANAAHQSPKVIFDNRFVKVYWHTGDNVPKLSNEARNIYQHEEDQMINGEQEPEIDLEDIARRQEEAQRRYEEKIRKQAEAQKEKEAINAQLQAIESTKEALKAKLFKTPIPPGGATAAPNGAGENEHTKALRAQLAQLEEEAKTLGIDPNAAVSDWSGPHSFYRGRGRGRGGFRGRFRGRGSYHTSYRGGAVKRLDNRPKTVCVAFADGTYGDHEEALRSHLLINATESATLHKHPGRADAALVSFPERYLAENFWGQTAVAALPIQIAELSWWTQSLPETANDTTLTDNDMQMEHPSESSEAAQLKEEEAAEPRDLDVADDDDRWG